MQQRLQRFRRGANWWPCSGAFHSWASELSHESTWDLTSDKRASCFPFEVWQPLHPIQKALGLLQRLTHSRWSIVGWALFDLHEQRPVSAQAYKEHRLRTGFRFLSLLFIVANQCSQGQKQLQSQAITRGEGVHCSTSAFDSCIARLLHDTVLHRAQLSFSSEKLASAGWPFEIPWTIWSSICLQHQTNQMDSRPVPDAGAARRQ